MTIDTPALIALHAAGLSDRQIASRLGCSQFAVWRNRRVLKLDPNHQPGFTSEAARRCAVIRNRLGLHQSAADSRWPGARTHREADVLDILSLGAATAASVARCLRCKSFVQAILLRLVKRGLLTSANVNRVTAGRPEILYGLAVGVVPGGDA